RDRPQSRLRHYGAAVHLLAGVVAVATTGTRRSLVLGAATRHGRDRAHLGLVAGAQCLGRVWLSGARAPRSAALVSPLGAAPRGDGDRPGLGGGGWADYLSLIPHGPRDRLHLGGTPDAPGLGVRAAQCGYVAV